MDDTPPRLTLLKVLIGAFLLPWRERSRYLRTLAFPTLTIVVVWALWAFLGKDSGIATFIVFMPLYLLAFSLFAVTCHRLVLVSVASHPPGPGSAIHRRILIFFIWSIVVYFIVVLTQMLAMTVVMNAPGVHTLLPRNGGNEAPQQAAIYMQWVKFIGSVPATYLLGRVTLVFPSIAMDRRLTLKGSWRLTSGNGWRMFVVVGLLPWAMAFLLSVFSREDSTVVEQVLLALAMYAAMAVEIFALSLAFKELVIARSDLTKAPESNGL